MRAETTPVPREPASIESALSDAAPREPPPGAPSRWPLLRLVAAIVATPIVLIYSWGFLLIVGLLEGRLFFSRLAVLVVGTLVIMPLTAGLAGRLSPRASRRGGWMVFLLWTIAAATLMSMFAGDTVPRPVTVTLFVLGSYWLLWLAWLFYGQSGWGRRAGVLAGLAALAVLFPLLLKPEGLTGDARVNLVWRAKKSAAATAPLVVAAPGEETSGADLSQIGPYDSPQFLGPARTGVTAALALESDWKAHPPREVWRRPIGEGWGAFAIVGDYCVTQDQDGDSERVACLRVADGSPVWVHAYKARFDTEFGGSNMGGVGPRATPTIHAGRVYAVGATGILSCLDGNSGRPHWSTDIQKDNGGSTIYHGVCGSPLIVGERVVVAPTGNAQACLAAYDLKTGRKAWSSGKHTASYGSPALVNLAGHPQILLYTDEGIDAHDAGTGEFLWSFTWTNHVRVNCSQPLILDEARGHVLLCTGYNTGSVFLEVRPGADGWKVKEMRSSPREMKTKFTTAVRHGDHLYGLDDGILACMNLEGKRLWKGGRYQHGQVLLAGDLLIVQAENGEVVLVQPDPQKLIERGRIAALSGKTWNNPALAGRYLLVRNDHEAACYELAVKEGEARSTVEAE